MDWWAINEPLTQSGRWDSLRAELAALLLFLGFVKLTSSFLSSQSVDLRAMDVDAKKAFRPSKGLLQSEELYEVYCTNFLFPLFVLVLLWFDFSVSCRLNPMGSMYFTGASIHEKQSFLRSLGKLLLLTQGNLFFRLTSLIWNHDCSLDKVTRSDPRQG